MITTRTAACLIFGVVLGTASLGFSSFRQYHAIHCYERSSTSVGDNPYNPPTSGILENQSTTSDRDVMCPIVGDDMLRTNAITSLVVDVVDTNTTTGTSGSVRVQACRTNYGSSGGACGAVSSTVGTGSFSVTPSVSAWGAGGVGYGTGYVRVTLPRKTTSTPSGVVGYLTSS